MLLRTRADLPFALLPLVWKKLLRQSPDARRDLAGTGALLVQMLDGIRRCERDGIATPDEFDAALCGLDLRFTVADCAGQDRSSYLAVRRGA